MAAEPGYVTQAAIHGSHLLRHARSPQQFGGPFVVESSTGQITGVHHGVGAAAQQISHVLEGADLLNQFQCLIDHDEGHLPISSPVGQHGQRVQGVRHAPAVAGCAESVERGPEVPLRLRRLPVEQVPIAHAQPRQGPGPLAGADLLVVSGHVRPPGATDKRPSDHGGGMPQGAVDAGHERLGLVEIRAQPRPERSTRRGVDHAQDVFLSPLCGRVLAERLEQRHRYGSAFCAQALQIPVPRQRRHQPQRYSDIAPHRPVQGRMEIRAFGGQPCQPVQLIRTHQIRFRGLRQLEEVLGVGPAQSVFLSLFGESLGGELPDGLQHAIPTAGVVDEGFVGQSRQQVIHLVIRQLAYPGDRGRSAASDEHGQPPQQRPLPLAEQFPAPLDHRTQRLVPRFSSTVPSRQQPEPIAHPGGDLLDRQGTQPRRGQLDRQRQPVEGFADPQDRVGVDPVYLEAWLNSRGPLGEQLHSRVADDVGCGRTGRRDRERGKRNQRLTDDAEHLPAGGQHPQIRTGAEQPLGQPGGVVDHVLTVVENDQHAAVGECRDQSCDGVGRGRRRRGSQQSDVAQAECADHRPRHGRRVVKGGEVHEADLPRHPGGRLDGQSGLPNASRAGQGH